MKNKIKNMQWFWWNIDQIFCLKTYFVYEKGHCLPCIVHINVAAVIYISKFRLIYIYIRESNFVYKYSRNTIYLKYIIYIYN